MRGARHGVAVVLSPRFLELEMKGAAQDSCRVDRRSSDAQHPGFVVRPRQRRSVQVKFDLSRAGMNIKVAVAQRPEAAHETVAALLGRTQQHSAMTELR